MTPYASPALYQPQLPHSVALLRGAFAALAIIVTAASWYAVAAQAGGPDAADQVARLELPPVVVSGQRERVDGGAPVLVSAASRGDCANPSASPMPGLANGANLER